MDFIAFESSEVIENEYFNFYIDAFCFFPVNAFVCFLN